MPQLARARAHRALVLAFAALVAGCSGDEDSPARPLADAGPDQSSHKRETVLVMGSGTSRPGGGGALGYRWRQVSGPPVSLEGADEPMVTFVAPGASATVRLGLVVTQDGVASHEDAVDVRIVNRPPIPVAGVDRYVRSGHVVTLDGRASFDPDGDALDYAWLQRGGPTVLLAAGAASGTAYFTAPQVPGTLTFSLVTHDGEDASPTEDTVKVFVLGPGENLPPTVEAGDDQTVGMGRRVYLYGTAWDPDLGEVSLLWEQTAGPAVVLEGATGSWPSFVAPAAPAELAFRLTASDGVATSFDTVLIHVVNLPPVLSQVAISPASPRTRDDLTVSATAVDPEGAQVTLGYAWKRGGVVIPGATGATLPASETARDDVITAVVTASDGEAGAAAQASVVIGDSPPALAGGTPAAAQHAEPLSFQIALEDPDGDPLPVAPFLLDHGPAGMTVSASGLVSWTPSQPLFDVAQDVSWSVLLATTPPVRLAGTLRLEDPARAQPLRRAPVGIPAWNGGLVVHDLDGDGDVEALVGGGAGLFVLARAGDGYAIDWMYPFAFGEGQELSAVAAADVDGDGRRELYASTTGGLVVLDGATRRERARLATARQRCTDLEVADLDGDGTLELACLLSDDAYTTDGAVVVLDAAHLTELWRTPASAGSALALGNVDADAALEVVCASGMVFDGATGANQWAYGPGFGRVVDTGDLDGDGVEEIVGMKDWASFGGYSAVLKSPLWQQAGFDFDALLVADLDGDAVPEIVTGDGQWGEVRVWSHMGGSSPLLLRSALGAQDHGVSALASGDLDGDGAAELVWGSGLTSSGADVMVVAAALPLRLEWREAISASPGFSGARPATVSDRPVLLFSRNDNALLSFDPADGSLRSVVAGTPYWSGGVGVAVADFDGDGQEEVALPSALGSGAAVKVVSPVTGSVEWTSPPVGGVRALVARDLTGDGTPDLVVTSSSGTIAVHDVREQVLVWQSTSAAGGVDVEVADVDGDGVAEIVGLSGTRVVVHGRTASAAARYAEIASRAVADGTDLLVADCDGDGLAELYVMSRWWYGPTRLTRLDGGANLLGTLELPGYATSLHLEALGLARQNLLVGFSTVTGAVTGAEVPELAAIDAETGAIVWRSPKLRGAVTPNALTYVDVDGDGDLELGFGTVSGVYLTR